MPHPLAVISDLQAHSPQMARRLAPLKDLPHDSLRIHEVYSSIQGEGTRAGMLCSFVRLTGCHLRCRWCDTRQAFSGGAIFSLDDVLAQVVSKKIKLVLITGGEPLLQPAVYPLMSRLCDQGHTVLLETSGGIGVSEVDPRVVRIIDIKAPDSHEVASNLWQNMDVLHQHDEIKAVLASESDYIWAKEIVRTYNLTQRCTVLFSPVFGELDPQKLVQWMLRDGLDVRVQVQLHKYIWDSKTQGV